MNDLISREALRRTMYHEAMEKDSDEQKWDGGCWIRYKMFERVLESIPPIDPVIRCRDCVWFRKEHGWNSIVYSVCGLSTIYNPNRSENDFCSYAERKDDESHPFADSVMMGD